MPSSLHDLITASHILHLHSIVDAYGHISFRNPQNPKTFFLAHNVAPALVASVGDLVEYWVEDGGGVEQNVAAGYKERFIHSELLKKFPSVNAVVHSHAESVIPYGISGVPMRAVYHMAGFLGTTVPVWDIAPHYARTDTHDLLVSNQALGAALASAFTSTQGYAARAGAAGISLVSSLVSSKTETTPTESQPDHTVVLMRGHGFTAIGGSIKEVVFRAVYTAQNASIQTTSLLLRNAHLVSEERGKSREEREKGSRDEGVRGLSESEVLGGMEMGRDSVEKPWGLWVREVEGLGLYVNEG